MSCALPRLIMAGSLESAAMAVVRAYESRDLDACRGLWEELTQWHRDLYQNPGIGGDDPGRFFDRHLELDLAEPDRWQPGETLAGREFRS